MTAQHYARVVAGIVAEIVVVDPALRPDFDMSRLVSIEGVVPPPATGCPYVNGVFGAQPAPPIQVTNKITLTDKATRATAANIADIAACDTISGTAAFTATQRDNAIRELARQSAVQARQLNVLIKLQLDQLDDTTGT